MNDTNPIQEQNSTFQPVEKSSKSGDRPPSIHKDSSPKEHLDEQAIDLNELFPDAKTDLNNLFPDEEMKNLLKNIIKNKKDIGLIKERLATENETPEKNHEEGATQDFSESSKTEEAEID